MLVPAKCPECGGNVVVNSEKEAWICDFCKTPFVVEKAINNFNTVNNVTNNIKADVVNVYENRSKDFVIKAGVLEKYVGENSDVVIPDNVERIYDNAFENCIGLKSVIIPQTVVSVGSSAFANCKYLEEIELPTSINEIGTNVFSGCENLKKIIVQNESMQYNFIFAGLNAEIIDISNLSSIPKGIFAGCYFKDGVFTVPSNIKTLQAGTFMDSKIKKVILNNGIEVLEEGVFQLCKDLESINLPDSLQKIGSWCFSGCKKLAQIQIPNSVKEIGEGAFRYCNALKEITFPSSIYKVPKEVLQRSYNIERIVIKEGIKEIGQDAFSGCTDLKIVEIPDSVEIMEPCFEPYVDNWGDIHKLNALHISASKNFIRKNIGAISKTTAFWKKVAESGEFCPECGSDYKGILKKICPKCGYQFK